MSNPRTLVLLICCCLITFPAAANAQETTVDTKESKADKLAGFDLAKGAVTLQQPVSWKAKRPRSRIVEREFAIPKVEGDPADGRLTMMRSGGSVEMNVQRWFTQFAQPDGKATKDVAKVTKKEINGQNVTIVDIPGNFTESMGGGPFAPGKKVKRENYRMLGGIVQTKASGQYFFKLYGPKKTIAKAEKQFLAMLESVKSGDK